MAPVERLIVCVGLVLLAACLTGLFVRRRQGLCVSFTLYLVAVLASDTLLLLWPKRFGFWDFWLIKESVHNLLKFGIALELTLRTFRAFPAARKTAAGLVLGVLLLTWLTVGPPRLTGAEALDWKHIAFKFQPYVLAGTVWLFLAISVLILWYRLPVAPLHKALLLGFVPYLLVFTVALNLLKAYPGDEVRAMAGYAKNAAYLTLIAYWTLVAWRPGPPAGGGRRAPAMAQRPAA